MNTDNDVKLVRYYLENNKIEDFIRYYISRYKKIIQSRNPSSSRIESGLYFNNFIATCRKYLFSNKNYYNYNRVNLRCDGPMLGPSFAYSLLLTHIASNAKTYSIMDAKKIYELLFWFEEAGISQLLIVPLNQDAKNNFSDYNIIPGYTEIEDGKLSYCSLKGQKIEKGGMEISNTRVCRLLSEYISRKSEVDSDIEKVEGEGGGGGKIKRLKTKKYTYTRGSRNRINKSTRSSNRRRRATRTRRN